VLGTLGGLAWTLAARERPVPGALAWSLLGAVVWHSRAVDDPDNLLIFMLVYGVATLAGLVVRLLRHLGRRARSQVAEQRAALDLTARGAVRDERQQFAREIHDVVSHAVGLIAMQAAAAEVSWPRDPDTVRRAVQVIASTTQGTLDELDRMLPGATSQHGAGELDALVARLRAAGARIELQRTGEPDPAMSSLVYRVVQEGLTNALRHAPGARVVVHVAAGPAAVEVAVEDDGPGPGERTGQPAGYGLVGLSERVGLIGGRFVAGAVPGGRGFRVEAHLPTAAAEVTS
jgi:signal transduction histidine kinase